MMSGVEGPLVGAVPLRPLGVAELLDAAARLVRRNLRAAVAIALPVEVARTVLVALVAYTALGESAPDPDSLPGSGLNVPLPSLLLQIFVGSLALTLLSGLLAPLFVEDALGNKQTTAQALRRVGRSWLPLAGLTVLVALGYEVGLVLLVVGGVWLWGIWAPAGPALVTERLGPIRALRRSFALAQRSYWRVWGVRALGWLVAVVLGALLTVPAGLLAVWLGSDDWFADDSGISRPLLYVTVTALGSLVVNLILSPFRAAIDTVLYLDLRMRREGLDLAVQLDRDAAGAAPPAPATPAW